MELRGDLVIDRVLLASLSQPSLQMIVNALKMKKINYEITENGINSLKEILRASLIKQLYDLIILDRCNVYLDICDLVIEIRKIEKAYLNRKSFICCLIEKATEDELIRCRNCGVNIIIKKPLSDIDLKKLFQLFGWNYYM